MSAKMKNIILVGMPGSGKSTIAALLAEQLGRSIIDADQKVIELAGKSIPDIFAEDGEAIFRQWETQALSDLGKKSQLIIATGGGCVTQQRNYPLLHQNGMIFWLQRELDLLPTDGRPLSLIQKLSDMYAMRKPMYEAFSDYQIDNNGTCQESIHQILSILEGNK